jgi:hypothetical protein
MFVSYVCFNNSNPTRKLSIVSPASEVLAYRASTTGRRLPLVPWCGQPAIFSATPFFSVCLCLVGTWRA